MLAIDAIHRVSLSIIVIAGVALAAEGLAAEAKAPDKTAAGTPAPVIQSGSGTATLTLTPQRGSTTFSGIIVDGAGQAGPTIQGAGTEFSPGTSTYSGITTITAGTLDLTAGKPAPPEAMPAVRGKGYYVITEGAGLGDNVAQAPLHRRRDGTGRHQPDRRPVAAFQHEDLDRPALRGGPQEGNDPARRLGSDLAEGDQRHELPAPGRRPGLHCRRQPGGAEQQAQQDDRPRGAALGLHQPGRIDPPGTVARAVRCTLWEGVL